MGSSVRRRRLGDQSLAILSEIAASAHGAVRVVELARNFGQHAAILAGFRQCHGEIVGYAGRRPAETRPRKSRGCSPRSMTATTWSADGARSATTSPIAASPRTCRTV